MPTDFKLKFCDTIHKVSFAKHPTWQELSRKISDFSHIPQDRVGVIYVDTENDEITLSTDEELQDYCSSVHTPRTPIKFEVRTLAPRPRAPPLEEILGQVSPIRSAFLESVDGGGSSVGKMVDNTFGAKPITNDSHVELSDPPIRTKEKSEERGHSLGSMSSTQSLLAAETGDKHPVHVYDVSSGAQSHLVRRFSSDGLGNGGNAMATENTPRASACFPEQEQKSVQTQETDDPPLPSVEPTDLQSTCQTADSTQSAHNSVSLAQDVASLLSTASTITSPHPELSESLRTIVQNTTNGNYWAHHREALSQAATELQRSGEKLAEDGRRAMEEEAGRRVTEALSRIFHIFSGGRSQMPAMQAEVNAQSFSNTFSPASGLDSTPESDQIVHSENPTSTDSNKHLSLQELKAKVEEAKMAYEAAKELYRGEKKKRGVGKNKGKTIKVEDVVDSQNPDVTMSFGQDAHIVANARHGFPRFDIVNVTECAPKRRNTHCECFPPHYGEQAENCPINKISNRLTDMGFTEKAYPGLRQEIMNQLPNDGAEVTKELEDDIITTLLEDMLAAPTSAAAVASGSRARNVPGGWH